MVTILLAMPTPAIQVRDLHLTRQGTPILQGLSCTLPAGQCTALLGPNGCGKTTFTRVLAGQLYPTQGQATVLNQTLGQTNVHQLRQRLALINPASLNAGTPIVLPRLSATDAVLTGLFGTVALYQPVSDVQRDHARDLLTRVGLQHHLDQPFGTLSTGEQRRCLVARALVKQPELLILDEPTAGLDLAGREQVLAVIEQILAAPHPPTVLMITHHVEELSPRTQHVILMRDGRFTQQGPPADIITPEHLSETFGCKVFVKQTHGRFWLEVLPEAWLDLI